MRIHVLNLSALSAKLDAGLEVKGAKFNADRAEAALNSANAALNACQAQPESPCKDCSQEITDSVDAKVYAAELVALLNAALKAQKDADKAHADQVKFAKKAMDAAKAASAHTAETKEKADKAKEAAKNAKEDIEKKKTLIEDAKKRQEGHKKDIEDAEKDADAAKDKVSWAHCVWARTTAY